MVEESCRGGSRGGNGPALVPLICGRAWRPPGEERDLSLKAQTDPGGANSWRHQVIPHLSARQPVLLKSEVGGERASLSLPQRPSRLIMRYSSHEAPGGNGSQ